MWCELASPQPPKSDPIWQGNDDGSIYQCVRPVGHSVPDSGFPFMTWLPPGVEADPPPNPEDLAWEAIASVQFRAIDIGMTPTPLSQNPDAMGAVHMPVWLWAENEDQASTGPVSSSASERGYTVSITARLDAVEWDLGDGSDPIRCTSWTPFDPGSMSRSTPVDCGSQDGYAREGVYTVRATSRWLVDWEGIGESGTIEFPLQREEQVRIGELQVLHSGGNG